MKFGKKASLAGLALAAVFSGAVLAEGTKAPIRLTDAQMDRVVGGGCTQSGSGNDATLTCTDTTTSPWHGPIDLTVTTTSSYAGPSCNSGNPNTGNCNLTGTDTSGSYYNNNGGVTIGKPYP